MTDQAEIRRTLIILAAYSLLFSFTIFPTFLALVVGGWHWDFQAQHVQGFLSAGFFCSIPSILYWFVALGLLLRGKSPRVVNLTYWVIIMPITVLFALSIFAMIANAFDNPNVNNGFWPWQ